jgi:hypothetical protein
MFTIIGLRRMREGIERKDKYHDNITDNTSKSSSCGFAKGICSSNNSISDEEAYGSKPSKEEFSYHTFWERLIG